MSPSKDGIRAMRRIAIEKAGQPEGEVARQKLWKVADDKGFNIHIYADIDRLIQAMNTVTEQMRKMANNG